MLLHCSRSKKIASFSSAPSCDACIGQFVLLSWHVLRQSEPWVNCNLDIPGHALGGCSYTEASMQAPSRVKSFSPRNPGTCMFLRARQDKTRRCYCRRVFSFFPSSSEVLVLILARIVKRSHSYRCRSSSQNEICVCLTCVGLVRKLDPEECFVLP